MAVQSKTCSINTSKQHISTRWASLRLSQQQTPNVQHKTHRLKTRPKRPSEAISNQRQIIYISELWSNNDDRRVILESMTYHYKSLERSRAQWAVHHAQYHCFFPFLMTGNLSFHKSPLIIPTQVPSPSLSKRVRERRSWLESGKYCNTSSGFTGWSKGWRQTKSKEQQKSAVMQLLPAFSPELNQHTIKWITV